MTPTSEERKHTPGPWELSSMDGRTIQAIDGVDGDGIPNRKAIATMIERDAKYANAELIVIAVNSYYSMRQALQSIAEENYDDDDKKRHLRATIDRMKSRALSLLEESKPLNS